MMWYSMAATILVMLPPPCNPGDLDRFPRLVAIEYDDYTVYTSPRLFERCRRKEYRFITGWRDVLSDRLVYLEANRAVAKPDEWGDWDNQISELEATKEAWGFLESAWVSRDFNNGDPRYILESLREKLGEQAYLAGQMPPLVPLRHYVDISGR